MPIMLQPRGLRPGSYCQPRSRAQPLGLSCEPVDPEGLEPSTSAVQKQRAAITLRALETGAPTLLRAVTGPAWPSGPRRGC